jgi:hypothetical protein
MAQLNTFSHLLARNMVAGKYADGQGLWLVKRDRQLGKWVLRLVIDGKRREMSLGRWPDVSIADARERAAAARGVVRDGHAYRPHGLRATFRTWTEEVAEHRLMWREQS